jgi:diguanylate cyclase (GGDEF)-like protein
MSAHWRRALCVLLLLALRAGAAERGFPLITVFPAETHKAGPQTFDITQDARGVLLFGNLHGLVTYDGAWWGLQTLPDDQAPLSLATDARGRVALGLVDDFGFLARDTNGSYEYHSLRDTLPAEQRNVGDIRELCVTPAGFLYVGERSLILWNGGNAKTIASFPAETAPRGCHSDEGGVFLRGPQGLHQLDTQTLRITPAGIDARVVQILRHADGRLIAVTADTGLFAVANGQATPFAPEVTAWLKEKAVTGSARLHDGRMVLLTRHHGLVVFGRDGHIEQTLGAEAGLPDAVLRKAFVDREGSLWVAMEGPIVRIDLASPVTVFDSRSGVRGAAGDVTQFGGGVYTATSHGLFEIDPRGQATRMEPMQESAWRVLAVDGELLAGTSKGIYRVTPGAPLQHIVQLDRELYDMHRSTSDPARIWIAHGDGVGSIRKNGAWTWEGLVPGVDHETASVVERDGVLWCGTVFRGVIRIVDPRGPKPRVQQFGSGEMNVFAVDGRVVFVRASGEVVQLDRDGKFVRDTRLGHLSAPRGFFVMAQDHSGNVWINSTPPRVYERQPDGSYAREGRPLVSVSAADIQNIRVTGDGAIWFAADKGLFRFDPATSAAVFAAQPRPLIRRVVAGEDRLLFGGVTAQREAVQLRHDFGRIRVEFAPASYRPGVEYQYRLDPIDTAWSKWTAQPFIDYTTLAGNDYTFRLRARGAGSAPSEEARWTFAVLPPWYATRWAYGLWILLTVAVVLLVIRARTGALQRQAETLRARVAEQTAELQETVKLLESANTQLEALSHEDDLTGIANRRFFERRLSDEWNRARRHEQPLALILLDLDHFKELNDRRGHPAGDDCLRRVGAFLSETIRRSGEVVARYGGEEFAILLPATDTDGTVRVAETLRDGIERLSIPYGNGRRMTASCGVAALTPGARATPEHLVASADRALYAAKHSGRNCVRVADESTTGTWLRDASA